jgi:hypothetical protein
MIAVIYTEVFGRQSFMVNGQGVKNQLLKQLHFSHFTFSTLKFITKQAVKFIA